MRKLRLISIITISAALWSASAQAAPSVRGVVRKISRNPRARLNGAEQRVLRNATPVQRAKALHHEAGFKLQSVAGKTVPHLRPPMFQGREAKTKYGRGWHQLVVPKGKKAQQVFEAVMYPGQVLYTAKKHTYVGWAGKIVDFWRGTYNAKMRRPSSDKTHMTPILLKGEEAQRYDAYIAWLRKYAASDSGWNRVMGGPIGFGQCAAWPAESTRQRTIKNSCTTPAFRPPIGKRRAKFAWIDKLHNAIQGNAAAKRALGFPLLTPMLGAGSAQASKVTTTGKIYKRLKQRGVMEKLERALPGQKANLRKLKQWVSFYMENLSYKDNVYTGRTKKLKVDMLPFDWQGRAQVAHKLGINPDAPGPPSALRELFDKTPSRLGNAVGVTVKWER